MAKYDNKNIRGVERLPLEVGDECKDLWCEVVDEVEFDGDSWIVSLDIGKEENK